ncbi:MAG: phage tail protein [Saprospiraceae bacterium]|nr:phage tail protein [Saprospiraceae bacterium]
MTPFVGQIQLFGFSFPPNGWALCNGQLLSVSSNTALFSLLGTIYGGDGRTTFALPDLRGRSAIGFGTGPGLSPQPIGQRSGIETRTLTIANMPQHSHALNFGVSTASGDETNPDNNVIAMHSGGFNEDASAGVSLKNAAATGNNGSSQSFSLRDPYIGLNYSIALFGVYPSRS